MNLNGVYWRNSLPEIKDGANVVNLYGLKLIGSHWIAFYVNRNDLIGFDNFWVRHIPNEIKSFIGNKNIIRNIYRIQGYKSTMCGYFFIWFIDSMLKGEGLLIIWTCFLPTNMKLIIEQY